MTALRRVLAFLVFSLVITACASTGGPSSSDSRTGISSDRIVVDELSFPAESLSAYELVDQYKTQWLQKRGHMSINNPVSIKVYVDDTGTPFGGVSSLRRIRVADIAYIEQYSGSEAQFKFGLGNAAGAIYVRTKPLER